jgi:hypothetical protein
VTENSGVQNTTAFQHGEVLDCECEDETILVVFHGLFPNGALVSPKDGPEDGFFVKLSDLRRLCHAE